ncbi:MAG: hypothetical protein ABIJ08_00595 [Nanoarchaeota archaeon]
MDIISIPLEKILTEEGVSPLLMDRSISRQHAISSAELTSKHTIDEPKLISGVYINLRPHQIHPLDMAFLDRKTLVVLGQSYDNIDKLMMALFDIESRNIIDKHDMGMQPIFQYWCPRDGPRIQGQFYDNLSVDENGMISVVSGFDNARFHVDSDLDDGYCELLDLLEGDHLGYHLMQATKANETYYFMFESFESNPRNILFAVRDGKLTGIPFNASRESSYLFKSEPRFQIHDGSVYFKKDGGIWVIDDGDIMRGDVSKSRPVIHEIGQERGALPSHHCVDPKGYVWAYTKTTDECFPSLKAFDNEGKFAMHVYDDPIVRPCQVSMAINDIGIMVRANSRNPTILFYNLEHIAKRVRK